MKTKGLNRLVAFTLALVMLLPMISIPTFADAVGGLAYPADAVWYESFETAASINDVCKSWAYEASVKASLTDSEDKVFDLPIKGIASNPYYLWVDKNTKAAFTSYELGEDGTLTGTATVGGLTYNVTGTVNTSSAAKAATVNSCSGTAKTVYIMTGEAADALGGVDHVAEPSYFRNPAWKNAEVENFVIDFELYLSVGAKGVIATQITGQKLEGGATRYIQPFKLTANGSSATLGLGDNGEMKKGTTKVLALGRWHRMTIVIDKLTSAMDIYANGVYAFTAEMKTSTNNYTKVDGPVNIVANSFLVQVNRGSTPNNLAGTVQIDDIAFYPSYKAAVWSESFEDSTTLTDYVKTDAMDASIGSSMTEAGDGVFNFDVKANAPYAYYLWVDKSTRSPITDYSIDAETGELTGDATVGGLTYNVTGKINTSNATTAATVNTCSGTAKTVYIMTGEAADARGGFLGNVARPVYFKNPAWKNADVEDFVIDMDFYMAPGTRGNFATQITARTVAADAQRLIQPFLLQANGGSYATLTANSNSEIVAGDDAQVKIGVWNRITMVIDKETSQVSMYVNGVYAFTQANCKTGNYVVINEPVNLVENSFLIQYNRGQDPARYKGTIQIDDISFYNSTAGQGLALYGTDFEAYSELIGSRPTVNEGFSNTPNTAVFAEDPVNPGNTVLKVEVRGNYDPELKRDYVYLDDSHYYPIEDGKVTVDSVVYTPSSTVVGTKNVTLTAEDGSTLTGNYQIWTHEQLDVQFGNRNIGIAATPTTKEISYTAVPKVAMQTKFYLSSDMKGKLEVQSSNGSWINVYEIDALGTTVTVKPHTTGMTVLSGGAVTVNRGEWFTVHLVWDLVSGQQDVYVNGVLAFSAKYSTLTNITINANSWYPVKIMRRQSANTGVLYADDIKVFDAAEFLEGSSHVKTYNEDFSAYKSSVGKAATVGTSYNKAATYAADPTDASNTVVKIPFAPVTDNTEILLRMSNNLPVEKGFYAVTRNADTNAVEVDGWTVTEESGGTYQITDGTTTYTGLILTTKDFYNAYWGGDGAIDQNWKLAHPALSHSSSQQVQISADYYISSDAVGQFQMQLHNYVLDGAAKSWLQLFWVDAKLGTVTIGSTTNKDVISKGAWNSFSLILDLASGNGSLYVNGIYVGVADFGDNLIIPAAKINFAKVYRKQNYYASFDGYIMVDNFSVGAAKDQTMEIEADKLMYVEVGDERLYTNRFFLPAGTPYVAKYFDDTVYADMLTTVEASSVRVTTPSGLRFATEVDTDLLDALFALVDEEEVKHVSFGTLIAPEAYVTTEFTKEALTEQGKNFLAVEATHGKYYQLDKDASTTHFVGSIVNILASNITRNFVGRGYATVKLLTGSTVSIYAGNYHTASVQNIATKALADTTQNWSEEARLILESFAAGNVAPDMPEDSDLEGLNVLAIGDSLFHGAVTTLGDDQWINQLGLEFGWDLTNLGIGGATISYQPDKNLSNASMYNLLFNQNDKFAYGNTSLTTTYQCGSPFGVKSDVDMILLQAGSNDYGNKVQAPVGTVGSTDPATFLGAWKLMVDRLLEEYPNAKVVMMTAWHNSNQSREDGANAVEYTSSVVDLYEELYATNPRVYLIDSGDPEVSGVNMRDDAFRAAYAHDAFHLNAEGMDLMSEAMKPYLRKIAFAIRTEREADLKEINVLSIGDSLFGGHSLADGEQWLELLAVENDWNLTNLGANGWTVAKNDAAYPEGATIRSSMYHKLMNDSNYKYGTTTMGYTVGNTADKTADDVDVIFLEGGWNDYGWNLPLGTATDEVGSTYMGAINLMVAELLERYQNAEIVLITAWHSDATRDDGAHRVDFAANGMKEVYNENYATNNRVSLIDAGDPELTGMLMTDTDWRAQYALDAVHLNAEGMELMAKAMLYPIWRVLCGADSAK